MRGPYDVLITLSAFGLIFALVAAVVYLVVRK